MDKSIQAQEGDGHVEKASDFSSYIFIIKQQIGFLTFCTSISPLALCFKLGPALSWTTPGSYYGIV